MLVVDIIGLGSCRASSARHLVTKTTLVPKYVAAWHYLLGIPIENKLIPPFYD